MYSCEGYKMNKITIHDLIINIVKVNQYLLGVQKKKFY
ncbi:hypothetical protein SALWKB2_0227 [Snodgrassella alvi wkB2]|nr:hypothetical protein SALWKB2_0227 [Snodgrassella alvi wkB2]